MTNKNDKHYDIPLSPSVSSWVYILYNTMSKDLSIGLSLNLHKQFSRLNKVEKMVYYRGYINSFDAVAHKHLLENLSDESIMHNVKQINPSLSNLSFKNIHYL
ncbi:MAG: hypothetical protein PHE33_06715 [Bacteroidales bacterium]|nr:hypothetical protein [Bacteroidales bacterium]